MEVPTAPRAQPRPRIGKGGHVFSNNKRSAEMKSAIIHACQAARANYRPGPGEPVYLEAEFVMPVKDCKLHGRLHTGKPDADNVVKTLKDALTRAKVIHDDSQISALDLIKIYGPHPGCIRLRLSSLSPMISHG